MAEEDESLLAQDLLHLCPDCRLQVEDTIRRAHLRGIHYGEIVAETHEPIVDPANAPQHRLDISTNWIREHIVNPEQINILPPLRGQEGIPFAERKRCEFRIITKKAHPEVGEHQLTLCISRYGQIVTSVSHPRSEWDELLKRGHYPSRQAIDYLRTHPQSA